jgi:hypothetical protein
MEMTISLLCDFTAAHEQAGRNHRGLPNANWNWGSVFAFHVFSSRFLT